MLKRKILKSIIINNEYLYLKSKSIRQKKIIFNQSNQSNIVHNIKSRINQNILTITVKQKPVT